MYDETANLPPALKREVEEANKEFEESVVSESPNDTALPGPGEQDQGSETGEPNTQTSDVNAPAPQDGTPAVSESGLNVPGATDTAEARYKVLQGKYNKELPAARQDAEAARNEAKAAREELAALKARIGSGANDADAGATADAVQSAGQDTTYDAMLKVVADGTDEEIIKALGLPGDELEFSRDFYDQQIRVQMATDRVREAREQQMRAEEAKQKQATEFTTQLDQAVPGWEEINKSDAFGAFCHQEAFPGTTWQQILDNCAAQTNVAGIKQVFDTFSAKNQGQSPQQVSNNQVHDDPLSEQVMPRLQANGDTTPGMQPKTYSIAQYSKLMDDITAGRITGEQADKLDAELRRAVQEWRITEEPAAVS